MHRDKGTLLAKECCSLKYFGSVFMWGIQKTWSQEAMISRFTDISQSLKWFHSETYTKFAHFEFCYL